MEQRWISVAERLPVPEMEVMVTAVRRYKDGECHYIVTPAIYEDGTVSECDSIWHWEDIVGDWDEGKDCYIIPAGWWEDRKYNPECTYNCAIDDEVTAWAPKPEPYIPDTLQNEPEQSGAAWQDAMLSKFLNRRGKSSDKR